MLRFALAAAILTASPAAFAGEVVERFPGNSWEQVEPATAGWSADGLKRAQSWSQQIGATAVMVIHHGLVVAQWGDVEKRAELASVRKSLLSALVGIAVAERQIDLDQTLEELGIDDNAPSLTGEEKLATVRELLQARSGVYHSALYETAAMAARRPPRGSHPHGTFWYYNNWDFNVLGAIYERKTKTGIFDALDSRIAQPTGMQDYRPIDGEYFRGKASDHPAYPIRMSARDLARFAHLYLHRGAWAGRQIVPENWVVESTRAYSSAGLGRGYGYLWWTGFRRLPSAPTVQLPEGSFAALGAGGQYAVVAPAYDLVIVHQVDRDMAIPEPPSLHVARTLWLLLKAGGFDPGPDAGIDAMVGEKLDEPALRKFLAGATLVYDIGDGAGMLRVQLRQDETATFHRDPALKEVDFGRWEVRDGLFCVTRVQDLPRCSQVVLKDRRLLLFDRLGIMLAEAQVLKD